MKALILAAGYGRRLYPLTKEYPKPLLLIAGRPIIEYIAEKLAKVKELNEIVVVTNDKFYPNFLDWAKDFLRQSGGSQRIKVINDGTKTEQERLGAIGDIHFVLEKERIAEDIIIFGGDNLFEESLDDFMSFSLKHKPQVSIGVYDIGKKSLAQKYGVVEIDASAKLAGFAEKPPEPRSSLIATCLYYIPAGKLRCFKEYIQDAQNEKDASGSFISWLSKREDVYGFVFKEHWYDIGDPQVYQEADRMFAALKKEKE